MSFAQVKASDRKKVIIQDNENSKIPLFPGIHGDAVHNLCSHDGGSNIY